MILNGIVNDEHEEAGLAEYDVRCGSGNELT
jgi:hypothetical protein